MSNIEEYHKDLDLLDLIQMFIKNKKMIVSVTAILTLIAFGLVYYLNISNKGSVHRNSNVNILVEDDSDYDSEILLDDLNNRISSAINYEKWRNQNKDLSKYLNQDAASSLLVSKKTQTINFNYSSQQNLDARISYVSYTTKIVLKKIISLQEKDIRDMEKNSLDEIKYLKEGTYRKINNYENKMIQLAHDIEVAKFKSSFFSKYTSNIEKLDENIFLSLMDNESVILENQNEISLIKNMINYENLKLESMIQEVKIKLQNDINAIKENLKVISVGQVTSSESLLIPNRDILYLLVPLTSILSFIFLLIYCFFKQEYYKLQNN
jgi:hypothetical protein